MSLGDKFLYAVVFDSDSETNPLYCYGPYISMGPAKRMLKQEEGRMGQTNGRIMLTKVKWMEVE